MPGADGEGGTGPTLRLRVRYTKTGKIRFIGHRDVVRLWERALRRSGLPVAWSEGFSPHLVISFGLALPTGAESLGEYLDIALVHHPGGGGPGAESFEPLPALLSGLLPEGIEVVTVAELPHGSLSLQQEVSSCSWELEVSGLGVEELRMRTERVLAAPKLLVRRERKGRTAVDDLRPALLSLAVAGPPVDGPADGRVGLSAELATRPRGVRPHELLHGLGEELTLVRARRVHQWIERDGARFEPLQSGRPPVAHMTRAAERAS